MVSIRRADAKTMEPLHSSLLRAFAWNAIGLAALIGWYRGIEPFDPSLTLLTCLATFAELIYTAIILRRMHDQ